MACRASPFQRAHAFQVRASSGLFSSDGIIYPCSLSKAPLTGIRASRALSPLRPRTRRAADKRGGLTRSSHRAPKRGIPRTVGPERVTTVG